MAIDKSNVPSDSLRIRVAFENIGLLKLMMIFDRNTQLSKTKAVVWLLGFGAGGATGLALSYALLAMWIAAPIWIAIAATLIATIHASIEGAS
jgi:hypothetical protein